MIKNKKPYILGLEDKDNIQSKYLELKTIKKVAEYYGISRSTMERYFRRFDIQYVKKIKNNFDESFFIQESPNYFYLAGFIAADGNISKNKFRVKIELADKDLDHLNKISSLISFDGKLLKRIVVNSKRNNKWKDTVSYTLGFSSKTVVNNLSNFNIINNKTKTYNFPDWLINHLYVHHFMRGYFDGDGHLGIKNNNKLRFQLSGNYMFLRIYQNILEKNCGIKNNKILIRSNGLASLEYQGNIIVSKICKFLYNNSTCHLDRKYNIYKDRMINYV